MTLWLSCKSSFFLKNGDKAASPSELTCPPGWKWEDDAWVYDINRAVDEKGNILFHFFILIFKNFYYS